MECKDLDALFKLFTEEAHSKLEKSRLQFNS
jgi:hypothetical protein